MEQEPSIPTRKKIRVAGRPIVSTLTTETLRSKISPFIQYLGPKIISKLKDYQFGILRVLWVEVYFLLHILEKHFVHRICPAILHRMGKKMIEYNRVCIYVDETILNPSLYHTLQWSKKEHVFINFSIRNMIFCITGKQSKNVHSQEIK